jgi:hypothetical protein
MISDKNEERLPAGRQGLRNNSQIKASKPVS